MSRTKGKRHHRKNRTRKGGFLGLFGNNPQQPTYPQQSYPRQTTYATPSGASTTNWWDSLNIFGKPKPGTTAPVSYSSPASTSYGSSMPTSYSSSMPQLNRPSYGSPVSTSYGVRGGRRRHSRKHSRRHRRH